MAIDQMVNSHEIPLIFNDDGNIPDMQLQNMKNMMGINGCHIVYGDEIVVYQSISLPSLPDRVSPTSVNGYPLNPSYAISINTVKIIVYQLQ